jgi:hypothetical protein
MPKTKELEFQKKGGGDGFYLQDFIKRSSDLSSFKAVTEDGINNQVGFVQNEGRNKWDSEPLALFFKALYK